MALPFRCVRRTQRAQRRKRALMASAPNATLLKGLLCLPMGTGAANYKSGDFGTSPFFEQLKGKLLLARYHRNGEPGHKAQWQVGN